MVISNIFPPHVRGGYELGILDVARGFVARRTRGRGRHLDGGRHAEEAHRRPGSRRSRGVCAGRRLRTGSGRPAGRARRRGSSSAPTRSAASRPSNVVALAGEIRRFRPDRIWIGNPLGIGPVSVLETALSAGVPVIVHLMDDIDRYFVEVSPAPALARSRATAETQPDGGLVLDTCARASIPSSVPTASTSSSSMDSISIRSPYHAHAWSARRSTPLRLCRTNRADERHSTVDRWRQSAVRRPLTRRPSSSI